ncbi:hypothetical protein EG328_003248 [Venturia inaequalis]|uniref:Uncharacterized protein n=1 Tax=Venturia inaequalis TaxID=5025 RepID=A0A8H3YVL7_VENIN|nr:hypothetical protein EG328_003248 [Venturia inaequalis]KAE9992704.1 hypothetical protein EG327_008134 [Venturia inaequalis]RDI81205.1 hypothetical protein Vi05172_g8717 [Venturia inaequalis]
MSRDQEEDQEEDQEGMDNPLSPSGFVEKNGLEFLDVGRHPAELMAFMAKNPGLIPGMQSLEDGHIEIQGITASRIFKNSEEAMSRWVPSKEL